MVIGMSILRIRAALGVPSRDFRPMLPAVCREVQIDAAADDVVGALWMHGNRVAVRDLAFLLEMRPGDVGPCLAAVAGAEYTEHLVGRGAHFVGGECIQDAVVGRTEGEAGAAYAGCRR